MKRLTVIPKHSPLNQTEAAVIALECCGGNLNLFITNAEEPSKVLFNIEKVLSAPENKLLQERWQKALKLGAKVELDRLRFKALKMLSEYSTGYTATDINYCKAILAGGLMKDIYNEEDYMRKANVNRELENDEKEQYREVERDLDTERENDDERE